MNTLQLEYFAVLADTLSYTRASEILGIAQPTLSKAIRHLESECGFPLFRKKGRGIILTSQGHQFLPYAVQSVDILHKGLSTITAGRETLRIGCVMAILEDLPGILDSIHQIYPNTFVKLKNGVTSELIDALLKHELDLIFCTPTDRYPRLAFEEFKQQQLYVAVYPEHPFAKMEYATVEMMDGQDVVTHSRDGYLYGLYHSILEMSHVRVHVVAEADEDRQVAALVRRRMGITFISTNNPSQYNDLVLVPLKHERFRRVIAIGYHTDDLSIRPLLSAIRKTV